MPHRAASAHGLPPNTRGLPPKDQAIIAMLAEETDIDATVVQCLYEEEIEKLQAKSSVKNFIGIIAARRVRQRIATAREHGRALKVRAA